MSLLDALALHTGDVRARLSAREGADGFVDLSGEAWRDSHLILRGLNFEKVRIARVHISPNFVGCQFAGCEFIHTESSERFWGADDQWTDCKFDQVRLHGMIAPSNVFRRCIFVRPLLSFFRPHNTSFVECRFEEATFKGLQAQGDTAFVRCSFTRPTFENCAFAHSRFESCTMEDPTVVNCSFDGTTSVPTPWWAPQQSTADRFPALVAAVLDLVRRKLGQNHLLVARIEVNLSSYEAGQSQKEDFEKVIFSPEVPAADMRRLDKPLFKLYEDYGH